jgi:hypothetical protein
MAGQPEVQRFFREAGDVDVDKSDIDRFRAFVDEKIDDIAIAARHSARWNNRDVVAPQDLPITKGLQERMREFGTLETAGDMRDRGLASTAAVPRGARATRGRGRVSRSRAGGTPQGAATTHGPGAWGPSTRAAGTAPRPCRAGPPPPSGGSGC